MNKTLLLVGTFFISVLSMAQVNHDVSMGGGQFSPNTLTIDVGDTVTWTNSSGTHNVNGTQATFGANPESFGNSIGTNWTYFFVFETAGSYDYRCDVHFASGMTGTITVNPASGTSDNTDPSFFEIVQNSNSIRLKTDQYSGNMSLKLLNIYGQQVASSSSLEISIDDFSRGIYFVVILNNSKVIQTRKVVL